MVIPDKSTPKYVLERRLSAHQDGILCLAVSNDGSLLASSAWLTLEDKRNNILCCGTGLGYVLFWKQNSTLATPEFEETVARRVGTGQEIMAINWCKGTLNYLTTVPRAVYFHGADILVFGMYDGEIHTLRRKGWHSPCDKDYRQNDPTLALSSTMPVNGFSLHRIEDGICTRTYDTNPRKGFPKQVAIAEGGSMVVGGSDDGLVYVFDKATSELVQTLRHSTNGRVQTVTQHQAMKMISPFLYGKNWQHLPSRHQKKRGGLTALTALRSVWQALPHLTALAVIAMFAVANESSAEKTTSRKGAAGHGNDAVEEYECDGPITTGVATIRNVFSRSYHKHRSILSIVVVNVVININVNLQCNDMWGDASEPTINGDGQKYNG
ncbi:hypothetical protein EDC04DRAFT_2604794 [Pisolithus marmoratus]|nr:hypothetical protein EDC04DRAFT_2604794 [Pisolithus marmoratus]